MALPRYVEIHNDIRNKISQGYWKLGDRLPSERELSNQFGVSRMTLRQAIMTLVDEGILERKIGSGTYVADVKIKDEMKVSLSFTELMTRANKTPSTELLSFIVTYPSVSEKEHLQLGDDDEVIVFERLRKADEVPILLEKTTIPLKIAEQFTRSELTTSLYKMLEKVGIYKRDNPSRIIRARLANEREADLLKIKRGDPLLSVRQITYDQDNIPFEYVRSSYVGERFEFSI